jgi:hypothetical protein
MNAAFRALDTQHALQRYMASDDGDYNFMSLIDKAQGFYSTGEPVRDGEKARVIATAIYSGLSEAAPYYFSPEMSDLVIAGANTMPSITLTEDLFPDRYGFLYYDKLLPSSFLDDDGKKREDIHIRAISWTIFGKFKGDYGMTQRELASHAIDKLPQTATALFTVYYCKDRGPWHGIPASIVPWVMGTRPLDMANDVDKLRERLESKGLSVTGRDVTDWSHELQIIAASLAFMNQRIIVTDSTPPDRATRRRLERDKVEPKNVQVVRLRKIVHAKHDNDGDKEAVEWSHRWVVSGHWRKQYYPSTDTHKAIWIMPYVKGPDSKPLKVQADKLFAVVR